MADYVWVIQSHEGWGEAADVEGVYATPEAARAALEKHRDVEVYTDRDGYVCARPVDEAAYPRMYAKIERYELER